MTIKNSRAKSLEALKAKAKKSTSVSSPISNKEINSKTKQSSPLKKNIDTTNYFVPNIIHNDLLVRKCKIVTSLLFGIFSGLLGLQAFQGFAMFLIVFLMTALVIKFLINLRANGPFIKDELSEIWMSGFSESLMTFILFWTLAYNGKWIFASEYV